MQEETTQKTIALAIKTSKLTASVLQKARVTRQALEQMKEIVHYISNDLMAPDAAGNLLDKMKAEITKLSSFPKKHALIDEEPWGIEGVRKIVVKKLPDLLLG